MTVTDSNKRRSHDKIYSSLGDQCDSTVPGGSDITRNRPEKRSRFDPVAGADLWTSQCTVPPIDSANHLFAYHIDSWLIHTGDQHLPVLVDKRHRPIVWLWLNDQQSHLVECFPRRVGS